MRRLILAVVAILCPLQLYAQELPSRVPDALMLRFPDIGQDRIVFVYGGDLWTVPRSGGLARRLSSPPGHEQHPKFSPSGEHIAFSGNYDGNTDVYVMSADGGPPRRLTHHPESDVTVDWYPDGRSVLYRSRMYSASRRYSRLFRQPTAGGMPEPLPMPYGEQASVSPDGSRLAFQLRSREYRTWKRYRGGMSSDIWVYDLEQNHSEKITDFDGTDALPMWHGDTIYFLSDRDPNKKLNIWAYNLDTKDSQQVTDFAEYDVKWPSLGPDAIVFENGGSLHVLDLQSKVSAPVAIRVPDDVPEARPQRKDASRNIASFSLSPEGKRALFTARGEIFTVPAKHGSARNLTNSSGVHERHAAWSPDGRHIAYFSDRTGEYELCVRADGGKGNEKRITGLGPGYRYAIRWSPDSKRIAYSDKAGRLFVLEVDKGDPRLVDRDEWSRLRFYRWSPDSRWLAYSKLSENRQGAIHVYDADSQEPHRVTGDFYHDALPVFSTDGKVLCFYSDRTFRPVYGDMDATWIYPNTTGIYAVTLRADTASPVAPRSDEVKLEDEEEDGDQKEDKKEKDKGEGKDKGKPEPVVIDFGGIESRVVKLPIKSGNFGGSLDAVKGKLVFLRRPAAGASKPEPTLVTYDFEEREEKTVLSGIDDYRLSSDGKKVLYRKKSTYGIVDLKPNQKASEGKLATDKLLAWVNPRGEWRQIFFEAWRIQRDFFYDPGMHGVDWRAIRDRYAALLPHVVDRQDLNYVIGEMIAELNASHTYVGGGDVGRAARISVGLLGCDFALDRESNAFRIARIHEGAAWDTDARSPLREPGTDVDEGDYLLAVNGRPLDTSRDPWASFQGLAGEVVTLTVNASPSMEGAREIEVKPVSSEARLRNRAWIERNRRRVEEATGGRVGYIYVPNTGRGGQSELVRQFVPQCRKPGLIIDERFNSGGQIPDRFIELLNRPVYSYWARRDHREWQTPFFSHAGPKVMLVNQWAGSGGDAFPYYFRKAGLGPLVGMRTWGGLIGISGNPRFVDGGRATVPTFSFWNTEGEWEVEGHGVDPDYEVENLPHEMAKGRDAQLEKAIEVVLDQLAKTPPAVPRMPRYPDRSR